MTISANWNGLGRNFPGLLAIVSPPVASLSDEEAEHARHIDHIVRHWAAENLDDQLSIATDGYVSGPLRALSLRISTTSPSVSPATEGAAVDSTISHDPFAPEGAEAPQDAPAPAAEAPEPEPEPVPEPVAAAGSEAESALDPTPPAESAGPTEPAAVTGVADVQQAQPEPEATDHEAEVAADDAAAADVASEVSTDAVPQ